MKATQALHGLGQSLWLDNITRELLTSGTLERYIDELPVTGLTSNPTIFDHAIKNSGAYDAAIREKLGGCKVAARSCSSIWRLKISAAADLFRPIYERTQGVDGWVSLEVSPLLAHDTKAPLRLPRSFTSVPGAPMCSSRFQAPRRGSGHRGGNLCGRPVNVTLLFSREQYLAAADAYLRGIERRIEGGPRPQSLRWRPCSLAAGT